MKICISILKMIVHAKYILTNDKNDQFSIVKDFLASFLRQVSHKVHPTGTTARSS